MNHGANLDAVGIRTVEPWMDQAACADPALSPEDWFPLVGQSWVARRALAVCHRCPVEEACFDYAMAYLGPPRPLAGIWGGTTERGRRAANRHLREAS